MRDLLALMAFLALYFVTMRYVLPGLGIQT